MIAFQIGQQVRCVNGRVSGGFWEWGNECPATGIVYTIRAVNLGRHPESGYCGVGLLLEEIRNPSDTYQEVIFDARKFVPLSNAEHDAISREADTTLNTSPERLGNLR